MQDMTTKQFHLGIIYFLTFSIVSCQYVRQTESHEAENAKKLSEANLKFAVDFYKTVVTRNIERTFVSSPFSISTLFSMIYAGAGKDTAREIQEALRYDDVRLDIDEVLNAYSRTFGSDPAKKFGADMANSVWIDKYFEVTQSYKDCLDTSFNAKLNEVDFSDGRVTKVINDWVSLHTNKKIRTLFDEPLPPSTPLALVNAIYFKGTWKTIFPKANTKEGDFHGEAGISKKLMMNVQGGFKYYQSHALDAQVLELDYADSNTSMLVILPNQRGNLRQVESILQAASILGAIDGTHYVKKLNVTLPMFTLETQFNLVPIMKSLNVYRVFDSRADLSGISSHSGLFVTEAVQKAVIEVNEEGTEAAAASGAALGRSLLVGKDFRADHPFLFLIRNTETNMVLFMGRVA